jgi:hypothetical protein
MARSGASGSNGQPSGPSGPDSSEANQETIPQRQWFPALLSVWNGCCSFFHTAAQTSHTSGAETAREDRLPHRMGLKS